MERIKKQRVIIWITAFVFVLTVTGLSVWIAAERKKNQSYGSTLEGRYQQAYYELITQTNDMEIKMAKLAVSQSSDTRRRLLYEIWKGCEVCGSCFSTLSAKDGSVNEAADFINKTGDYCYYLAVRADEEEVVDKALPTLETMRRILKKLGEELAEVQTAISDGWLFLDNLGGGNDILSDAFNNLSGDSVEYPQLIYDGPFSDALKDKEALYLKGKAEISGEQAKSAINSLLQGYTVENVTDLGEWQTDLDTFNFSVKVKELASEITVQITRYGGVPLSLSSHREVTDPSLSGEECAELGRQYLEKIGFEGMEAVWISDVNSNVYVNYAPVKNGVIYYPDLIKLKMATDNGQILGMEANNYIYNHTERELPDPVLTEAQAKEFVSPSLSPEGGRLTLIPKGEKELLCYEFTGNLEGEYYVYIDAVTGNEANILYVIETDNGQLIM